MNRKQMKCWVGVASATLLLECSISAQCQRQELLASNGAAYDYFGWAVALEGDWAAIGAPFVENSGSVYVFHRTSSGWVETQELKAGDAASGAVFGSAVALSGTSLAVGAPGDDDRGILAVGAVYVFDLGRSTWTETVKLRAGDPAVSDNSFGDPIAMEGDRLLIGARNDDGPGKDSGAAYVFDRVEGMWTQTVKLVGSDVASNDGINLSVALSGDKILLGVPYSGPPGQSRGAAYTFERGPGGWAQTQKLLAGDGMANDQFGFAVALTGESAVVGAPARNTPSTALGAAYVFQRTPSGWIQTQEFWADGMGSLDLFGERMACSPEHLLVGSTVGRIGSAYEFRWSGSIWEQAGKLLPNADPNHPPFGVALAIHGNNVLVGAPIDSTHCPPNHPGCAKGAAYICQFAPTATQFGRCPSSAPRNNTDPH